MNILDDALKEETVDDGIDENEDNSVSTNDNEMPLCGIVGLGLLGVTAIGFTVCKLFSSSKDTDEV